MVVDYHMLLFVVILAQNYSLNRGDYNIMLFSLQILSGNHRNLEVDTQIVQVG